jgi:hypothetical protein
MPLPADLSIAAAPRRTFLHTARNVGLLGAALSWLGHAPVVAAPPTDAVAPAAPPESGYHETDHIRKYYAAARYF